MGGISGQQIGQILGAIGGGVAGIPGGPAGIIGGGATGSSLGSSLGGAIDPQTGLPIPNAAPQVSPDPGAAQDASSAQLQANAAQVGAQPDPNQQLLQLLLMLANQGAPRG